MTQNVLITGASKGIGRAIAVRLARQKMHILAHGRDHARLNETRRLVEEAGGSCQIHIADLSSEEGVQSVAAWATMGSLDIVVHNAGVGGGGPVAQSRFDHWNQTLNVDLRAPMMLTALTLASVVEREGAFVFIGSIAAKMGMAGSSAYCAAKHGLEGFASALFEEVREKGVRVVRIHPGYVNTDMVAPRSARGAKPELASERMIQADDIAELVNTVVELPVTACVTEMVVRPQRTPYR